MRCSEAIESDSANAGGSSLHGGMIDCGGPLVLPLSLLSRIYLRDSFAMLDQVAERANFLLPLNDALNQSLLVIDVLLSKWFLESREDMGWVAIEFMATVRGLIRQGLLLDKWLFP